MTTNQTIMIDYLTIIRNKMEAVLKLVQQDEDCLDLFNSTDSYPFTESFDEIVSGMEMFVDELKGVNIIGGN